MFLEERGGTQFTIKLLFFKKKRKVHICITTLCQFKYWKYCFEGQTRGKLQNCPGVVTPPQLSCICNKSNFFTNALYCLDPSQYVILSQLLLNSDFFYFGIGPDFVMKVLRDYIIILIWGFCLISIISKNKCFQFGVLLKMPPSSPSMEEFSLDIQK